MTPEPFHAVFCQDWRFRARDHQECARLTEAELRAAPHMRGSPRVHAALAGCVGRPDEVNNPQHRLRITKAPKIRTRVRDTASTAAVTARAAPWTTTSWH
ncbi:hypothetical protein [Streptomyces sp. SD15]